MSQRHNGKRRPVAPRPWPDTEALGIGDDPRVEGREIGLDAFDLDEDSTLGRPNVSRLVRLRGRTVRLGQGGSVDRRARR